MYWIIVITVLSWQKIDFENSKFEILKIINVNQNFKEIMNYNRNFKNTLRKLCNSQKWIIMWFIIDVKDTFNRDFFGCNFFKFSRYSTKLFVKTRSRNREFGLEVICVLTKMKTLKIIVSLIEFEENQVLFKFHYIFRFSNQNASKSMKWLKSNFRC